MGRVNWVQVAVFGLVALLVLLVAASLMSPWTGRFGGMMGGGGMMGPGMLGGWGMLGWMWMLLIPIVFVAVLVLGLVWLARQVSQPPAGGSPAAAAVPCPHCGRLVQVGWRACPYCGGALVVDGPPDAASS